MRCINEDCPRYQEPVDVRVYDELGRSWFEHEEQARCATCGAEME